MLSSIRIPNYWNNVNVAGAEAPRNDSIAHNSWLCNPLTSDNTMLQVMKREKTPEGYRRIRGTHKGNFQFLLLKLNFWFTALESTKH